MLIASRIAWTSVITLHIVQARLAPLIVLAFLSLSVVPNAFAATELAYDNGIVGGFGVDWGLGGGQVGVKFQVTPGSRLLSIRTAAANGICSACAGLTSQVSFTVHILAADGVTPLTTPFLVTVTAHGVGASGDPAIFETIDVASKNIVLTDTEFFVIFASAQSPARLYFDNQVSSGRSYETFNTPIDPSAPVYNNRMIRADVGFLSPVGGVLAPVNKLEILTPYLALAGLVVALSAVVVVRRRQSD